MYGGRETELHAFITSVMYGINGESHFGCFKRSNVPINMDIQGVPGGMCETSGECSLC